MISECFPPKSVLNTVPTYLENSAQRNTCCRLRQTTLRGSTQSLFTAFSTRTAAHATADRLGSRLWQATRLLFKAFLERVCFLRLFSPNIDVLVFVTGVSLLLFWLVCVSTTASSVRVRYEGFHCMTNAVTPAYQPSAHQRLIISSGVPRATLCILNVAETSISPLLYTWFYYLHPQNA